MSAVDPDLDLFAWMKKRFWPARKSRWITRRQCMADAVVVPMDAGWSDVGSCLHYGEISTHTAEGNVCHGDVINHKTESSYVYAESGLVTTVGRKIWW
ncbi:hypothetical protein ACLBOM_15540 [Escherichia coli]